MKKKRFTEEQIIKALKRNEAGETAVDICRELGVANTTFYYWKQKYSGMEVRDAQRLKSLEEENKRLKRMVAEQALDIQMLKDVNSKKW